MSEPSGQFSFFGNLFEDGNQYVNMYCHLFCFEGDENCRTNSNDPVSSPLCVGLDAIQLSQSAGYHATISVTTDGCYNNYAVTNTDSSNE